MLLSALRHFAALHDMPPHAFSRFIRAAFEFRHVAYATPRHIAPWSIRPLLRTYTLHDISRYATRYFYAAANIDVITVTPARRAGHALLWRCLLKRAMPLAPDIVIAAIIFADAPHVATLIDFARCRRC